MKPILDMKRTELLEAIIKNGETTESMKAFENVTHAQLLEMIVWQGRRIDYLTKEIWLLKHPESIIKDI